MINEETENEDNINFANAKINIYRGFEFLIIQMLMLGPILFIASIYWHYFIPLNNIGLWMDSDFFLSWRLAISDALAHGELLFWNPYQCGGVPGLENIQSRALAGVANGKYLFVLPGSPSACMDAWDQILTYQLDFRHKPCNFVEIMPRLLEGVKGRKGKT